jgi:hypothetical protein
MPDRDHDSAARQPASAQQPQHDENDRRERSERQEGGRDGGKTPTSEVPQAGMNPELGDMDAEADPDRDPDQGGGGLPGKMGGGLLGG